MYFELIQVFFYVNGKNLGRKRYVECEYKGYSLVLGEIFVFLIFKVGELYIVFQQELGIGLRGKFVYFFLDCVFRGFE